LKKLAMHATLVSTLALGACAGATNPFTFANLSEKPAPQADISTSALPQTELQKATEYWGKQYEANPKDAQPAINYIRNLKALGAKQQALAVAQNAFTVNPNHKGLASEYGRLALELDQVTVADRLLAMADDPVAPDWKVISARGTVLAKQGRYREAIPHFERALAIAPGQPSVLNNLALAQAMDGHAEKAEPLLRQAANDQHADPKVGQNLALVLGLQGKHEDAKSVIVGSAPSDEVREDATFVSQMVGAPAATTSAQQTAQISTSSTGTSKAKNTTKNAKAKPAATTAQAPAEDPSVTVQRLADGFANTPPDAPVQLMPKR
jgi:Flp pilus assembly protein TadD